MRPTHTAVLLALLIACDKGSVATPTGLGTAQPSTPTAGCPDADLDGICDADDLCAGDDATGDFDEDGTCNDLDDDDDGDGCADLDDPLPLAFSVDDDLDGAANDCDPCPADNPDDTDGDGVCDGVDVCPSGDDTRDTDGDAVPDGCDPCPLDNPDDTDGDLVCDADDLCQGFADGNDPDGDGIPEDCDLCPGENPNDTDGDMVCDSVDVCPGGDDHFDIDNDGTPDGCDPCPFDYADDSDGDGSCDSVDTCPGYVDGAPDADGDGFRIADGDCDDCDPNIGPQMFDVPASGIDEDCDGTADNPPAACDSSLTLSSTGPLAAAAAMDICTATPPGGYGLAGARWVRANGSSLSGPGQQVGMLADFGSIGVQFGSRMFGMSSGHARDANDAGACNSLSCLGTGASTPPAGFPQDVPGCVGGTAINDDVALKLDLVAPMNAVGFKIRFYFLSFEWPEYVCSEFNDQFIILMDPAPTGAINGNIAFDSQSNPVSVNIGYLGVCDPVSSSQFARWCTSGCPSLPSPYCPLGAGDLTGTGFDAWAYEPTWGDDYAGGTGWLEVAAPVTPGQAFSLRLAIWDTYDQWFDSTVLLDHFEWVADPVDVGVQPQQ